MKHVKKTPKIFKNKNKNPEKLQMIQKKIPFLFKKVAKTTSISDIVTHNEKNFSKV
jgi:hypothetical protein